MESSRFDEFTKALVTSTTRRRALRTLAVTLGGVLGLGKVSVAFAEADPPYNGAQSHTTNFDCGFGCLAGYDCVNGQCLCGGQPCPFGFLCSNGQCVCPCGQTHCGDQCCPYGYVCSNGQCVCPIPPCCPQGERRCGTICCPQGGICCQGHCCPAGSTCGGNGLCE